MGTKTLISVIALFGFGALFSFINAWLILVSPAIRLFTDRPGNRKVHQKITPRVGGISIVSSFLLFTFIWHCSSFMTLPHVSSQFLIAVIIGTIGIATIGLLDDIILLNVNSRIKLLMEVLIAILLVAVSGIKFETINLLDQVYQLGIFSWPVTVLWLVGVTNALNIIDGVDGLSGTVALISFFAIGIFAYLSGDYGILIFCTLFAGLIFGFLVHNIHPARIFLGDTGSLFLGMMIGLLCIYLVSLKGCQYPTIIAPLIVGFPLLDVGIAMFRRFFKAIIEGKSLLTSVLKTLEADNDHIHHRLMFRGLRHSQTTFVIAIYAVTTCAIAVVIGLDQGNNISIILFLAYLALITLWFTYKLGFFDNISKILIIKKDRNEKLPHNSKRKMNIIVINADEFLKHALESFKQEIFSMSFLQSGGVVDEKNIYSAILVNNTHIDNQEEELNHAINLSARLNLPVAMVANEFTVSSCDRIKRSDLKILCVSKPIYVPKLFNDLYLFMTDSDSVRPFNCVFTNETRVASLSGRINNESI